MFYLSKLLLFHVVQLLILSSGSLVEGGILWMCCVSDGGVWSLLSINWNNFPLSSVTLISSGDLISPSDLK